MTMNQLRGEPDAPAATGTSLSRTGVTLRPPPLTFEPN